MSNDEIVKARSLISILASSRPDSLPNLKRLKYIEEVTCLLPNSDVQKVLSGWNDLTCSSPKHGYIRVIPLFTKTIVLLLKEKDIIDIELITGLSRNLCRLLKNSQSLKLLKQTQEALVKVNKISSSKSDQLISIFEKVATENTKDNGFAPAISLGFALDVENCKVDWYKVFVNQAISSSSSIDHGSTFYHQVELCQPFLFSYFLSPTKKENADEVIENDFIPLLTRKFKSNPERIFTVLQWLVEITNLLLWKYKASEELLSVLTKHLASPKYTKLAESVFVPRNTNASNNGVASLVVISPDNLQVISKTIMSQKSNLAVQQRQSIYRVLDYLSSSQNSYSNDNDSVSTPEPATSQVLETIIYLLSKETATTSESKQEGMQALLHWMIVSIRKGNNNSKSYELSLDFIRQPFEKLGTKASSLKKKSNDKKKKPKPSGATSSSANILSATVLADCKIMLASMIRSVPQELLETLLVDLFQKPTFYEGLLNIINNANFATSATDLATQSIASKKVSSVPVESLLSLYSIVLYATALGGKVTPILESTIAGSKVNQQCHAFLSSYSILNAVSKDKLVSNILPKTLSLLIQLQYKSTSDSIAPTSANMITDIMSYCITHPYIADSFNDITTKNLIKPTDTATTLILETTQRLFTYQLSNNEISEPLILKLWNRVLLLSRNIEELTEQDLLTQRPTIEREKEKLLQQQQQQNQEKDKFVYTKVLGLKGQASSHNSHNGFDSNAVRRVIRLLVSNQSKISQRRTISKVLILMHIGTTLRLDGNQRKALIENTLSVVKNVCVPLLTSPNEEEKEPDSIFSILAEELVCKMLIAPQKGQQQNKDKSIVCSETIHKAILSVLTTMGSIACNYIDEPDVPANSFAYKLCVSISKCLNKYVGSTFNEIQKLTENEINIFKSPLGSTFGIDLNNGNDTETDEKNQGKANSKKKGGFTSEDELWEQQIKKELSAKKDKKVNNPTRSAEKGLLPEEKKLVSDQDQVRLRIRFTIRNFLRVLESTQQICLSDIEIGNQCLPTLSTNILSLCCCAINKITEETLKDQAETVEICSKFCKAFDCIPKLKEECFKTLSALTACVWEIDEVHSIDIGQALVKSSRCVVVDNKKSIKSMEETDKQKLAFSIVTKDGTTIKELELVSDILQVSCKATACAFNEMEQYPSALSGNSFFLLFPILRAALKGPRTTLGCESALTVLDRHAVLLAGNELDPIVFPLRKDMAIAILELLKHDRAQTFQHPTPYEALISCYRTDTDITSQGVKALSSAELAPLLNEHGALGNKSCRVASMKTIGDIASRHKKLIKNNPLIENRIWLNCFDKNEDIKSEARKAWKIVHSQDAVDDNDDNNGQIQTPPSIMYAVPLLSLLSHKDPSIASAAADAYANAMALHPRSTQKNVQKLCNAYIESFPTMFDADGQNKKSTTAAKPKALASKPAIVTKKKTSSSLGLPKRRTVKKTSALGIAGIGKAKSSKKKSSHSALLKPKVVRTLDREALDSQFVTDVSGKKDGERDSTEKVQIRIGILRAIAAITNANVEMDITTLKLLTTFLLAYGIAEVDEKAKSAGRNALCDVLASNGSGEEAIIFLLPHIETVLKTGVVDESYLNDLSTGRVPNNVAACDRRKEGAVVALGSVALHLKGPNNESKIDSTIDMLLVALHTPSEEVQSSVALCLAKLMKKGKTQQRVESILSDLLRDCFHDDSLAVRRGSAYGIAAAVKGSGIATLKKYEVVKRLEESCSSGTPNSKEGSLFAIELLSIRLGLLFEPYVIVLLPSLLRAFSDNSEYVRKAASHTTGLIMSKLSAHGVKLVMPALLTSFNDPAWRTKEASIRMLGSMSHLAPKQLASALPKVVPKLTEAFGDTHPRVKKSAQEALDEISTVIRNPEISSISSILLKTLTDPAALTVKALEVLIETEFLHAIDAPSLALIVPILHRGLRDRAATTKRYGALIAGNICSMINDPKDFVPYLSTLLPDIQTVLLDPIPDVRSTAAKALGSLTRGLGDIILPTLRPWLLDKVRSEACNSAERSGAAQGLTEVLIAAGNDVVEEAMIEEIIPLHNHQSVGTREGVLWMLTFLPPSLGQGFTPLLDASLPALVGGLSDDSEQVREVAMRASRVLIRTHGKVHVEKILPGLELGLADDEDYRTRLASLSLLGDLLSTIGGTTLIKGDGDTREDIRRAERAQVQIALTLGDEKRKQVLSSIYIARCDSVSFVRQSAIQVWKTVVSVTARTLREIMPVLVGKIIDGLASGNIEKTEVAGKCLGDVIIKLGETVLSKIVPILRDSLYDADENTKCGVCVGLTEVIKNSTKDQVLKYLDIIIELVQDALCDENENVRVMAASSFKSLYFVVGSRALDEIVPSLMVSLEASADNEVARNRALNGLTGIISVRSRDLLPYIIPRLIERPIPTSHLEAISGIARVAGDTISLHFTTIIPTILSELAEVDEIIDDKVSKEQSIRDCARSICAHVDVSGVNWLISEIASKCSSDKQKMRKESCWMIEQIVIERKKAQDFYDFIPVMLRELMYRMNDDKPEVVKASQKALLSISKNISAEELVKHVEYIRNHLASIVSDARRRKGGVGDGEFLLPGFNIPKGLEPMLPIFQRGILYGDANIREVSASGLGEIINLTSKKYLAGPLIIKMTGPLLRIVGDRNPSNVKIAILCTLGLILVKGGVLLRAFVPQFQTTFVKALFDPSRQVRKEAIKALSFLMPLSTRVDPLIKELVVSSLGKSSPGETGAVTAVQTATLEALATVLEKGGKKAKLPDSIPSALDASQQLIQHEDDGVRQSAAKVMGASLELLGSSVAIEVIENDILDSGIDSAVIRHGKACAIRRILESSVGGELDGITQEELRPLVLSFLNDDKAIVKEGGYVAAGTVIGRATDAAACLKEFRPLLLNTMQNDRSPMEIHQAVAHGLCLCLRLLSSGNSVDFLGKSIMDAALQLALRGSQRVQYAYNNLLWLALDVTNGQDGLNSYSSIAEFDNVKGMKSLYTKVLVNMKGTDGLDD